MKIPYFSQPDFEKLYDNVITVKFPTCEKDGVFLKKEKSEIFPNMYECSLIYRDSDTCINEIMLSKKDIKYLGKNKIISKNAPVWCHHKGLEQSAWPSKFSELEKILNSKIIQIK